MDAFDAKLKRIAPKATADTKPTPTKTKRKAIWNMRTARACLFVALLFYCLSANAILWYAFGWDAAPTVSSEATGQTCRMVLSFLRGGGRYSGGYTKTIYVTPDQCGWQWVLYWGGWLALVLWMGIAAAKRTQKPKHL